MPKAKKAAKAPKAAKEAKAATAIAGSSKGVTKRPSLQLKPPAPPRRSTSSSRIASRVPSEEAEETTAAIEPVRPRSPVILCSPVIPETPPTSAQPIAPAAAVIHVPNNPLRELDIRQSPPGKARGKKQQQ